MRWLMTALVASFLLAGCSGPAGNDGDGPGNGGGSPGGGGAPIDHGDLTGFSRPLLVTHAGDGSNRLFVVEQSGTIIEVSPAGERTTFIDIMDRVNDGGNEQGLLGMAFHPDFAQNGVVILSYTGSSGDTVLERYTTGNDGLLDAQSGDELMRLTQPFSNHNGGHIAYGPDGYLYVGLGDGGSAGDPAQNGQNPNTLLGSILRIDVGPTGDYSIPSDNPFANSQGGAAEVWLYGLRNPWRFSFDSSGDLWIGDVGQDAWEEISHVTAAQAGGNLGWNIWEGTHHFPSGVEGDGTAPGYIFPVAQIGHGDGDCSITGGVETDGIYYFADFCSGRIWSMPDGGARGSHSLHEDTTLNIASFGTDEAGNVYVVSLSGSIHRLSDL